MHKTIAALVLALTVSPMAAWAADGPGRGMSKAQVRQQFGKPARVQAPVGNPPIGRWHYPDFTVYFENDIVLHSVSEDRAARSGEDDGAGEATTIRERREGKSLPADVENEEAQIEVESRIENRDADSDDDRDNKRDDDGETDESDVAPGTTGVRAAGVSASNSTDRGLEASLDELDGREAEARGATTSPGKARALASASANSICSSPSRTFSSRVLRSSSWMRPETAKTMLLKS